MLSRVRQNQAAAATCLVVTPQRRGLLVEDFAPASHMKSVHPSRTGSESQKSFLDQVAGYFGKSGVRARLSGGDAEAASSSAVA